MVFLRNSGPYDYGGGVILIPMQNWNFFPSMDPFFNDGFGYFENPLYQRRQPSCRYSLQVREPNQNPNQYIPICTDDRRMTRNGKRSQIKPVDEEDDDGFMTSSANRPTMTSSSLPMTTRNMQRRGAIMGDREDETQIVNNVCTDSRKTERQLFPVRKVQENPKESLRQVRNSTTCKQPYEILQNFENSPETENIQTKQEELPNSEVAETFDTLQNVEFAPQIQTPLKFINKIREDLNALQERIASFNGMKTDREYLTIDELLTRALLELDSIDSQGNEEIRKGRKELVVLAYSLVERLEKRFNQMDTDGDIGDEINTTEQMNFDSSVDDKIDDERLGLANFIDEC